MDETLATAAASTWIAGPRAEHAIEKAVHLHNNRIAAVIKPLEADMRSYMSLLAKINGKRFSIVVDSTHLGLYKTLIGYKACLEHVLTRAELHGIRTWIDTPQKKADAVIETYRAGAEYYP